VTSPPLELGAYSLLERAGTGGMAVVWRGVHRQRNIPVAIKVVRVESSHLARFATELAHEVRIMASLDHPHVVRVFDQGVVGDSAAVASGGELAAGSPYFVMEWLPGGVLRRSDCASWPSLKRLLVTLLDTLAHAHARGIVHCDIKPANLLKSGERGAIDALTGLKLVDFGIARAWHVDPLGRSTGAPERHLVSGTPAYMSPEQAANEWRTLGPWTDLYALGCLAFLGCTGRTPYQADSDREMLRAHCEAPLPTLHARYPVPGAFGDWVRRLLAKEPRNRFVHAADAKAALLAIVEDLDATEAEVVSSERALDDEPSEDATVLSRHSQRSAVMERRAVSERPVPRRPDQLPPMPLHWRSSEGLGGAPSPRGIGLGLEKLRAHPVIDRDDERDVLWSALSDVVNHGLSRFVLLRGGVGVGKTRLAEWLAHRADELGVATPLRVVHHAMPGAAQGVVAALARHLKLLNLDEAQLSWELQHLAEWPSLSMLGDRLAFAELLRSASSASSTAPLAHFASLRERHVLLRRLLEDLARARPLLVTIDDAAFSAETLAFVTHALDTWAGAPAPVLFVVSADQGALVGRPVESAALARLQSTPVASTLNVGALPPEAQTRLVRETLGLDQHLGELVDVVAHGNPMFAVLLVQDWLEQGLLEPSEDGLRASPGAELAMPSNLQALWSRRVTRALQGHGLAEQSALELAAVLGLFVDGSEWSDACREAGLEVPQALLELLLREDLARAGDRGPGAGWQFAHPMLRFAVEERSRDAGRWSRHQLACAAMLAKRGSPEAALRRGRHFRDAGLPIEALDPLLDAAHALEHRGDLHAVRQALDAYESAVAAAGLPDEDERKYRGALRRAVTLIREGRMEEADALLVPVERLARVHGLRRTLCAALARRIAPAWNRGSLEQAFVLAREARELAETLGDGPLAAEIDIAVADARWRSGDHEGAVRAFGRAREGYAAAGRFFDVARAQLTAGAVRRAQGRLDEARAETEAALESFERFGARLAAAKALNVLGDILRDLGLRERADTTYREALSRLLPLGSGEARFVELNLALMALEAQRSADARRLLEQCHANLPIQGGEAILRGAVLLGFLACDALEGRWASFDQSFESAEEALGMLTDPDNATFFRLSAEAASRRGQPHRAARAWRAAARQWRKMGREDTALELEALADVSDDV